MQQHEETYVPLFVREVMPGATEQELARATENLWAYLGVLYRIFLEREERARQWDSEQSRDRGRFEKDDPLSSKI